MKIGIFGDSYAARHKHGTGLAWFEHLQKNHNLDVTCFGQPGSSLYYSYTKFIKHHIDFDKVVFLVTGPGRLTLPIPPEYDQQNDALRHVTNYDSFKFTVDANFKYDNYLNRISEALKLYYTYLMDVDRDLLYHQLLIKEIQQVRPDGLFIPCFNNLGFPSKKTLFDIHYIDIKHYNLTESEAVHRDIRHCHMNYENNTIFSNLIKRWIDTGEFDLDQNFSMFTPSVYSVENFFHPGPIPV